MPPHVGQPVKPQRRAQRDGPLVREDVGHRFGRASNRPFRLEISAIEAANLVVLGLILQNRELLIGSRIEQPPRPKRETSIADGHAVAQPWPLCSDVIGVKKPVIPHGPMNDIAVPVHDQDMGACVSARADS